MSNLAFISPLGARSPKEVRVSGITITEVTDTALASVACRLGHQKTFETVAREFFGVALPSPGNWSAGAEYSLIWTGPDQWFAEAPFESHEDISRIVKAGLGDIASVTEQTDGWARFDIVGANTVDMFERLCAVNTRQMKTGQATRTVIEHLGCFLICRETGSWFSVIAPRSSAASMLHALEGAARSVA